MIKYQLNCKKCKTDFDSWFASSKEYERLRNKKLLSCIDCGSISVEKSLMAPNLFSKKNKKDIEKNKKIFKINKKLKEYKKFVEKNLDYVGTILHEANLFIMEAKRERKEFMEKLREKILKIYLKKELKHNHNFGLRIKKIILSKF